MTRLVTRVVTRLVTRRAGLALVLLARCATVPERPSVSGERGGFPPEAAAGIVHLQRHGWCPTLSPAATREGLAVTVGAPADSVVRGDTVEYRWPLRHARRRLPDNDEVARVTFVGERLVAATLAR